MNSDAEKVLFTSLVHSKSDRKDFFLIKIFRPIRFREKIKLNYLTIGIERPVNADAEKILLTFVALSKSGTKKLFFLKIFRPIRIREKIKFKPGTFSPLESRDQ